MAKKILLADDSITIQKVVELTFSDGDFEVVAVNNGAKAIQKLQESRPDVILSDIIMPEKNGYEVCEFVKSHPEFRNIPVILLTGTFEPFDPDRAERAGCDAVVTKPFESQSLIHKVEELIQQFGGPSPEAPPIPESSPFDETKAERRSEPVEPQPADETAPFEQSAQPTPEEIFGSSEPPPRDESVPVGFSESNEPAPFNSPETASAAGDEPEASATEPQTSEGSWSAETTAFPKMSFDDLRKLREQEAPDEPQASSPETETPPASAEPAGFGAGTESVSEPSEPVAPAAHEEAEPAGEDRWSAETTAIPKMSSDLPKSPEPEPEAPSRTFPWESAPEEQESEAPEWPRAESAKPPAEDFPAAEDQPSGFGFDSPSEESDAIPFTPPPSFEPPPVEPQSTGDAGGEELLWNRPVAAEPPAPPAEPEQPAAPAAEAADAEPEHQPAPAVVTPGEEAPAAARQGRMSEDDVDRVARKVVELLSDKTVRDIAWEVIPDLAETIVRNRIRQLEDQD